MDMAVTRRLAHRFGISLNGDSDTFKVLAFKAEERLSETYRLQVELSSRKADIDIDALLEKDALLTIEDEGPTGGEPRYFHGLITGFKQVSIEADGESGHAFYSVTVEPDLALLKLAMNARIYQAKTTKEIATEILQEGGVRKVKWLVTRTLQPRELCCQWQESNFQFFQRLMSECGIWWYFNHSADGHELVLTDRVEGAGVLKPESIEYNGIPGGNADKAFVYRYSYQKEIGAGKATQRDYSFHNVRHNYESYASIGVRDAARELYFYPGRYKRDEVGKDFTRMWLESHRALLERGEGASNINQLVPGYTTSLTGYRAPYNRKYLIVSVLHEGTQPQAAEEGASENSATHYNNSFVVIPDTIPFRPPQHQKPVVEGPMMATIVGPPGEEIYCDSVGRVRIWLPWDRADKKDDSSSCWVRVAQSWAGPLYGQIAIPRIGHEVLVDFLDGDIDQMFISGRAYHDTNRPPNKLPDDKTKMTIRSKTHKGHGFNELTFQDETNQEEVYLRAEKDMNVKVFNNHTETIDNHDVQYVGHNRQIEVKNNHDESIGGNMTISVGPSGIGSLVSTAFSKLAGGIGDIAKGLGLPGFLNPGEGNMTLSVEKNRIETIGISDTLAVGMKKSELVGLDYTINVGKEMHIVVGDKLTITVGKATFTMEKDGSITMTGTNKNVTMGGPIQMNGKVIDMN